MNQFGGVTSQEALRNIAANLPLLQQCGTSTGLAIAHERYLAQASAIGVSRADAEAELRTVRQEGVSGDDHETAWARLVAGDRRG
jgi:hypothetical protein